MWLEVAVLLAVAVGCVAAAEKKTGAGGGEGTCDADAKGVIAAGKKLSEELEAMKKVDSLGDGDGCPCVPFCVGMYGHDSLC